MLEVSFNELSTTIEASSKAHAADVYAGFMVLADNIMALKIAPLRIRSYIDLANKSISKDYYSLKDWLRTITPEERQRYLGYLAQDPIVVDNPAYYFNDIEAKGFGYAVNNDLCSVSYSTNNYWSDDSYVVQRLANHENEPDVEIDEVTVNHCLLKDYENTDGVVTQRINHIEYLLSEYKNKQELKLKSLASIDELWNNRSMLFPYLDFSPEVLYQISNYGSLENASLQKSISYLFRLNNHIQDVFQGKSNFVDLPGDVSNDSEATLNMFGEERNLPTHDGGTFQYTLHSKLGGNLRIYMMPRATELRITIGYIGNHMRTKNFKK